VTESACIGCARKLATWVPIGEAAEGLDGLSLGQMISKSGKGIGIPAMDAHLLMVDRLLAQANDGLVVPVLMGCWGDTVFVECSHLRSTMRLLSPVTHVWRQAIEPFLAREAAAMMTGTSPGNIDLMVRINSTAVIPDH